MVFSNVAADHMVSLDCHYSGYTAEVIVLACVCVCVRHFYTINDDLSAVLKLFHTLYCFCPVFVYNFSDVPSICSNDN